ncbi:hypothetical protein CFN78_05080 [Amycolatopsis antarctica]|uniref:DUF4192 domain-containing protein n=1 Tax=Amycolatopsis antarctica TaxID=1854586 RepID=A0A263D7Y2_9PSEU|nr:DUF4192 domain-containing protein [Amycolatopsis antarctica]OZM74491.1 hypothetical protein CFN78_05080 [Amycolatopsis antarctica]
MTTSTTSGRLRVDLRDPGQLLAGIPHLLGFRPSNSVVLIGHRGPAARTIGAVARADLPPAGCERDLAARLMGALLADGATGATLAIVGGRVAEQERPGARVVAALASVLRDTGLRLLHVLRVPDIAAGAAWACDTDPGCAGLLPDPATTALAAASATVGVVTFGSREAMASLLDPVDEDTLGRRSALLDAAADAAAGTDPDSDAEIHRACALVRRYLRGPGEVVLSDDEEVVALALAVSRPRVRDACLTLALPAGSDAARVAERLWLALVRATPRPERAHPACLLGFSAYMRGDGALAGMALENALTADPGHVLAGLLFRALDHHMLPKRLEQLGRGEDQAVEWLSGPEISAVPLPRDGSG